MGSEMCIRDSINTILEQKEIDNRALNEDRVLQIVRHTQSNPRHFFFIMREILTAPQENSIEQCIESCAYLITREVFGAYRHIYPHAQDITERFIAGNPSLLSGGELEQRYNWYAKKYMDNRWELYRMLLDMGIVGKVASQSNVYTEAEFQYNSSNTLAASTNDKLCVHPVFSICYKAVEVGRFPPILPRGVAF